MIDWDATSTKKDPFRLLFASIIMSYIVDSNPKAKELAIAVKIHDGTWRRKTYVTIQSMRSNIHSLHFIN